VWPWVRVAPRNLGLPFNISATAEVIDFKFDTQLEFVKAHYNITPRGKSGRWPWARVAPQNFGFPYNISATARAGDFKFGSQLGFAKARHKIPRRRKGGHGLGLEDLSKILGFLSIFVQQLKVATSN